MQVEPRNFAASLERGIPPLTFVHGTEVLLVEEICDVYLKAARAAGYDEREVSFAESGFSWEALLENSLSMSLFGGRKVLDVRLSQLRMDGSAGEVLKGLARGANPDTRVLLRAGEVRSDQQKSAWYKSLVQSAVIVNVRGISHEHFRPWLMDRLKRADVRLTPDALELLCSGVEGNLLAAVQEIERLKLLGSGISIDRGLLESQLEDSSHHDGFAWIDALFKGDAERVVRILHNLRQEGQSPIGPLYLLVGTLRRIMRGDWMPDAQKRLVPAFRLRAGSLDALLSECALLDLQAKGQLTGEVWESLINLSLRLCRGQEGRQLPDLESRKALFTR